MKSHIPCTYSFPQNTKVLLKKHITKKTEIAAEIKQNKKKSVATDDQNIKQLVYTIFYTRVLVTLFNTTLAYFNENLTSYKHESYQKHGIILAFLFSIYRIKTNSIVDIVALK